MLSKLLASENLYVQCDNKTKTASFNTMTRTLNLPDWQGISESLLDMLIVHEVGHALYTPHTGWIDDAKAIAKKLNLTAPNAFSKIQGFLNVVEDARIDKLQKRKFPGTKRDYNEGLIELHARDFFEFSKSNKKPQDYSFIDRMNIYFKGGYNLGLNFNDQEKEFIKSAEVLESWKDVVDLTYEIYKYALDNNESNDNQTIQMTQEEFDSMEKSESQDGDQDGDQDGPTINVEITDKSEEDSEDSNGGSDKDDNQKESTDKPSNGGSDKDETKGNDGPSNKPEKGDQKETKGKPKDAPLPEAETSNALDKFSGNSVKHHSTENVYIGIPTYNLEHIVDDYKVVMKDAEQVLKFIKEPYKKVMEFKNSEISTISYLVKEFEMKKAADAYSRINISKTGVLNTNKLHSYMYNDDIFKRNSVVTDGKNHGFIMLLDWSSSMNSNLMETMKQLITLSLFYRRVNVPFDVYLFRNPNTPTKQQFNEPKGNHIQFSSFKLRNILSSRMKEFEFNTMISYLWNMVSNVSNYTTKDPLMYTPLDQSLLVMEEIVQNFRKRTKVQITNVVVLTDGDSNCHTISNAVNKLNPYIIYDDRKTRTQYKGNLTKCMLEMLKVRTGVNLVGFYICGTGDIPQTEKDNPTWTNEGFVETKKDGYDSHYYVNRKSFKSTTFEIDDVNSDVSINSLTNNIIKQLNKKQLSRVLLRRFIDNIIK